MLFMLFYDFSNNIKDNIKIYKLIKFNSKFIYYFNILFHRATAEKITVKELFLFCIYLKLKNLTLWN